MIKAFISGCAGSVLTDDERAFFKDTNPWGLILFARNIETPEQVSDLTESFRQAVGRQDAPVLVDQEGGRVQRLRPPHWRKYPAPKLFGDLYGKDPAAGRRAAFLGAQLIAADLSAVGITVDCLPCLDVRFPETVDAIGDRAMSEDTETVSLLGRDMVNGALAGGVLPVIKHIPGHGRAKVDSHLELPRVLDDKKTLETVDFQPFKALRDVSLGMTAHLLYESIDPDNPGTQSRTVIEEIIRKEIGFDGCLMSDDISMKALGGTVGDRSRKIWDAGCDVVLHCNGEMDEMRVVADAAPDLAGRSLERCEQAMAGLKPIDPDFDNVAAWQEFQSLTGWAGV
ncbi:beta-N-acetylhexosaminidase [Roseibium sp.]|uniref:beta-N-acetylhexosaminidase n=1 Tax=Roseibium sp. TaxID=1936156 RepID=UPI003B516E84